MLIRQSVFNESELSWYQKKVRLFLYDLLTKGAGDEENEREEGNEGDENETFEPLSFVVEPLSFVVEYLSFVVEYLSFV
ncbi:MAG: hypothetical protein RMX35_22840, partial [Nostoc sp. DcaGUA01]|nr:hypothetical protein [Nostoc sp. DcaGUA01]